MNKLKFFLVALVAIFPVILMAQNTSPAKDTLPSLNAGDLEDEFENSMKMAQKIIIIDQKKPVTTPKGYSKKDKKIFVENMPVMQNDNFAIIELPEKFTGFKIELLKVQDEPLPDDDDIFFRHGNVVEEMINETEYAYSIGNFKSEEEATEFMELFLADLYPDSRVISYENGIRN